MQAASDIFLGWERVPQGLDGRPRDFYVRQLWDWKASADFETMPHGGLMLYGRMCGWTLARAHGRSGDRVAIAAYLGSGAHFDEALATFAAAYADQNARDHEALGAAVRSGQNQRPVSRDIFDVIVASEIRLARLVRPTRDDRYGSSAHRLRQ